MTSKERFLNTLLFKQVDRVPFTPGGPRESTLHVWRQQGLPEGVDYMQGLADTLGIIPQAGPVGLRVSGRMIPEFEEKVLHHGDGHYLVQDWMGAVVEISDTYDVTYLRVARDFVTRKWHKCPVESREEFRCIAERYTATDMARYVDLAAARQLAETEERATSWVINGPFWQMREWMGFEGLCFAMAEQPEFVDEMTAFWMDFVLGLIARMTDIVTPDHVMINEDMAYKVHAMISPAMTRRWVLPSYVAWREALFAKGCSAFEVDSDGYVGTLLPLFQEAGVNCNSPVEVAAGNDIVAFRDTFAGMAFRGGIDKRCMAAGGEIMRQEVLRVVPPLLKTGGFIPSCDHGVPSDISWPDFVEYSRLLAQLCGWL